MLEYWKIGMLGLAAQGLFKMVLLSEKDLSPRLLPLFHYSIGIQTHPFG
jgi:hypothetical protein